MYKIVNMPSSYIGGGSTTTPTETTDTTVVVDGTTVNAGTTRTSTNSDGTTDTGVIVDTDKIAANVASAETGSSVQVTVPSTTASASAQLVVKDVETMAGKQMSLDVISGSVSYNIPATAIDTASILSSLGATDPASVPLTVKITPHKDTSVSVKNGTIVVDPVSFEITATYGGKTVSVTGFEKYVSRTVEVTSDQAARITTAVVKQSDGTERHVPTNVYSQNGKYYAKINSLTNSTYVLIYNEKTFGDASGKWYQNIVNEMASREIINGKSSTSFDGDGDITRAEFAAILIRSLGLPADGTSSFSDVSTDAWYYGSVGTAVQYGLIKGYEDGTFRPTANITRQEAMAMMERAAKVAEYTGKTGTLSSFKDASEVSDWATSAAAFNVGSGLIVGSDGAINPNDNITRAESATVILRLLQKSGLVDLRSKT